MLGNILALMRLWSVHPRHLDRQGLTGCWREALLAQAVLAGRTRGYRSHSQLVRFRGRPDPLAAVGAYLEVLADDATRRGYRFDRSRIDRPRIDRHSSADDAASDGRNRTSERASDERTIDESTVERIPVTDGQVAYEWAHLLGKLAHRSPDLWAQQSSLTAPHVHPLFEVVPGPIEPWERSGP